MIQVISTTSNTSKPMHMDAEKFVYWLQGFFEITGEVKSLTPEQIKMIKDHLGYVFHNQPAVLPQSPTVPTYPGLGLEPYPGFPGVTITC